MYPNEENMLIAPNYQRLEITMRIKFVPFDGRTLILKKMLEKKKLFLLNQSIKIMSSNEENVFMVPNHQKVGDYYGNPCLSNLTDKL